MNEFIIEVNHLYKSFKHEEVLKDVNLTIEKGSICGIVGRNGSGKTVLFKCICGFFKPDSGEIKVRGKRIGKETEAPKDVGIIIESPGFLRHYSGYKNLEFLAGLNGIVSKSKIEETLELVGLLEQKKKKVGKYSMGMRQRLGIAQAIMENQDILILDEPMNGLDNRGVDDMRRLFLELKRKGTTILLASHNKEDIKQLCDVVYQMDHGNLEKFEFVEKPINKNLL